MFVSGIVKQIFPMAFLWRVGKNLWWVTDTNTFRLFKKQPPKVGVCVYTHVHAHTHVCAHTHIDIYGAMEHICVCACVCESILFNLLLLPNLSLATWQLGALTGSKGHLDLILPSHSLPFFGSWATFWSDWAAIAKESPESLQKGAEGSTKTALQEMRISKRFAHQSLQFPAAL